MLPPVDLALRVVVLDRPANGSSLGGAGDGPRSVLGIWSIAVLEVDRDGKARGPVEHPRVVDDLVQRHTAVEAPKREGKARAGGRKRLEAQRLQDLGGARVPRVRDDERFALVQ